MVSLCATAWRRFAYRRSLSDIYMKRLGSGLIIRVSYCRPAVTSSSAFRNVEVPVCHEERINISRTYSTLKNSDKEKHPMSKEPLLMRALPENLRPYGYLARIDKPIGTCLLLWPCLWSSALAAGQDSGGWEVMPFLPEPKLLALFTVGSFVMRGAGCTINDMWDKEFDKSVERTKTRPLACGDLSMTQAAMFLTAQLTTGLGVLISLPHLDYCFKLGAASLPLVVAYPLMKRYTNWPQLVLGMTFNWGALMGWAATHGTLDLNAILPLYISGICWTIVYDTLYAHQDKLDDAKLGLKSTALFFGDNTKPILHGFSVLTLAGWTLAGYGAGFADPVYFVGCTLGYSHLVWQIQTADLRDSENLAYLFKSNNQVGAIICASCVAGSAAAASIPVV